MGVLFSCFGDELPSPSAPPVSITADRRQSWEISEDEANSAMELMKSDGLTEEEMNDDLRVFLYAKGIMRKVGVMTRKEGFNNLLNPSAANVDEETRKELAMARERLSRIVVKGEEGRNFNGKSLFDVFVSEHPEWGPESSFVVFRDHDLLKNKEDVYVERIQHGGLCHMHAPVVLQHYLVAMHSEQVIPMLDMAIYLRKHISAKDLEFLFFRNTGSDSQTFLESILLQNPRPKFLPRSGDDDLESHMMKFGPALISRFEVEGAFDSPAWQHLGDMKSQSKGHHAMVLVGVRKEGDDTRYLIQNWWNKKPFVEVDAEYLVSCGALVLFVKTPQTAMSDYPVNTFQHVECELLDIGENFHLEM